MNKIVKTALCATVGAVGVYAVYHQISKTRNTPQDQRESGLSKFLQDFKAAQAEREEQLKQGLAID